MDRDRKTYHWCAVPHCASSSTTTPEKIFISVPYKAEIRNKWLELAGRRDADKISPISPIFLCEDHFNLPNDMENYTEYRIMGTVKKIRMRPGCMPSKCYGQDVQKCLPTSTVTSATMSTIKRQTNDLIKESETSTELLTNRGESSVSENKTVENSSFHRTDIMNVNISVDIMAVKEEPRDATSIGSEAAVQADLYSDHVVKRELVIGPEVLQPPDVMFAFKVRAKIEKCEEDDKKFPINSDNEEKERSDPDDDIQKSSIFNYVNTTYEAKNENAQTNLDKCFTCPKCKFMFSTKLSLLKHKRSKHGIAFFSCNKCHYAGGRKEHLKKHLLTHTREKAFKCPLCEYRCSRRDVLIIHNRIHTKDRVKALKCGYCNYSCDQKKCLLRHEMIHTGEKPYKCSLCTYSSRGKLDLKRHESTHRPEKSLKCDICDYTCTRKSDLSRHKRSHAPKRFSCSECSFKCSKKKTFSRHQTMHSERTFKCNDCSFKCCMKNQILKHMSEHIAEFKCNKCDKSYNDKQSLRTHKRKHSIKRFKCDVCSYRCTANNHLINHKMRHTGEKPYVCDCGFECRLKNGLRRHQMIHTGLRPLKCTYCDYRCREKSALIVHERIHNDEKPYKCDYCTYSCRSKSNLNKHMKIH